MEEKEIIEILYSVKQDYYSERVKESIDSAIDIIKSKNRVEKELEKAIKKEKTMLDQFTDDFNHHLWIMRGLKVAKAIIEGNDYKDFIS